MKIVKSLYLGLKLHYKILNFCPKYWSLVSKWKESWSRTDHSQYTRLFRSNSFEIILPSDIEINTSITSLIIPRKYFKSVYRSYVQSHRFLSLEGISFVNIDPVSSLFSSIFICSRRFFLFNFTSESSFEVNLDRMRESFGRLGPFQSNFPVNIVRWDRHFLCTLFYPKLIEMEILNQNIIEMFWWIKEGVWT